MGIQFLSLLKKRRKKLGEEGEGGEIAEDECIWGGIDGVYIGSSLTRGGVVFCILTSGSPFWKILFLEMR